MSAPSNVIPFHPDKSHPLTHNRNLLSFFIRNPEAVLSTLRRIERADIDAIVGIFTSCSFELQSVIPLTFLFAKIIPTNYILFDFVPDYTLLTTIDLPGNRQTPNGLIQIPTNHPTLTVTDVHNYIQHTMLPVASIKIVAALTHLTRSAEQLSRTSLPQLRLLTSLQYFAYSYLSHKQS